MPKTLPANIILEKNKVESENPWLLLLDVHIDEDVIRIANNNADVTFDGETYQAFPFMIDAIKQTSSGKINGVSLSVSNVNKAILYYVESTNGLINSTVTLYVVNANLLTEDYSELTLHFTIMGASVDEEWIVFTLSSPSPLRRRFPQDKYLARFCNWTYKGAECKSTHGDTTCKKTKDDCESKGNLANFGGYPGLFEDGLRIVR